MSGAKTHTGADTSFRQGHTEFELMTHIRCHKVKTTLYVQVLRVDEEHVTPSAMVFSCGMLPQAFSASIRCLSRMSVMDRYASKMFIYFEN